MIEEGDLSVSEAIYHAATLAVLARAAEIDPELWLTQVVIEEAALVLRAMLDLHRLPEIAEAEHSD